MRSIPNTITEYPGETGGSAPDLWIRSGKAIQFWVASTDPEVRQNVRLVVEDVLKAEASDTEEWYGIYTVLGRYTVLKEKLAEALDNVGQHHRTAILWREVKA